MANTRTVRIRGYDIVFLDMKGCICHVLKWQIHFFIPKGGGWGRLLCGAFEQLAIAQEAAKLLNSGESQTTYMWYVRETGTIGLLQNRLELNTVM